VTLRSLMLTNDTMHDGTYKHLAIHVHESVRQRARELAQTTARLLSKLEEAARRNDRKMNSNANPNY